MILVNSSARTMLGILLVNSTVKNTAARELTQAKIPDRARGSWINDLSHRYISIGKYKD